MRIDCIHEPERYSAVLEQYSGLALSKFSQTFESQNWAANSRDSRAVPMAAVSNQAKAFMKSQGIEFTNPPAGDMALTKNIRHAALQRGLYFPEKNAVYYYVPRAKLLASCLLFRDEQTCLEFHAVRHREGRLKKLLRSWDADNVVQLNWVPDDRLQLSVWHDAMADPNTPYISSTGVRHGAPGHANMFEGKHERSQRLEMARQLRSNGPVGRELRRRDRNEKLGPQ